MGQTQAIHSIAELEALIRSGDFATVTKAVSGLNRNKIPRSELASYAHIANRVNQGRVAHRFLQPVIRSDKPTEEPPSDKEKIEYAEALRIMQLIEEAKSILGEIDPRLEPLVHLRFAFCLMTQWKYSEAIPHLESYIASVDPKEYTHTIAKVNLAAALVIERRDEQALSLLEALKEETKRAGHQLLYGNCLELMAQLFVCQGQCGRADQILAEAEAPFSGARNRYSLYMRKWKAISKSLQLKAVHPDLSECRDIAVQERDWETLRECDLYIGYLTQDEDLLNQVYFGTPYPSYRKRIHDLAGTGFLKSETYVWNQIRGETVSRILDVVEGEGLEQGRLMHRLLMMLASDFYKPLSIVSAFSELFPDEHFSQQGSTNRVSQIVKRLRAWAKDQGGRISIEEIDGNYILKAGAGTGIQVPLRHSFSSSHSVSWNSLLSRLPPGPFSKNDVIRILDCSSATAIRLLRTAISSGQCVATGAGSLRRYLVAK